MKSTGKFFMALAVCFYFVSAIMLYKGYDKMTNYHNYEYSTSLNENAYVGGDAYNYIINGNYATGFFVLSMGFLMTGAIFNATSVVLNNLSSEKGKTTDTNNSSEELPNI